MDTTNLQKIREELLSCGVCLETFKDPRVLPCQHTFCQNCIVKIGADKRIFRCPTCREQVIQPKDGVEGFKRNFEIASFCEKLVVVKKPQPAVERTGDKCEAHKKEIRRFYCQQCKVAICSECILDIHQGHAICSAAQAAGASKDRIGGSLKLCKERIKVHEDVLSGISDNDKKLEAEKKAVESTIRSYAQQLIDDVNKTAAILLQELESHFMSKQMRLVEQKDSAQSTLDEVSNTRDWAEQRLNFTEAEVIGMEDALCRKLEVATAMRKLTPDYISLDMDFFPAISPTGKSLLGHLKERSPKNSRQNSLKTAPHASRDSRPLTGVPADLHIPGIIFFGQEGSGEGQLAEPRGMTVTPDGRIFVMDGCSDVEEGEIKEYDSMGQFVGMSFQPHYFQLAADNAGHLFCTRPQQETVEVLDKLGTCVQTFGRGHLAYPLGIAIDPVGGQVLVSDTQKCKVFIHQPDGVLIRQFGSSGRGDHELSYPICVAVDSAWNIFVSDHDCHCVKVFTMMGSFRAKIGKKGSKDGQFKNPKGLCVDAEGNVIVADSGNGRVSMFDLHGKFSRHLLTPDQGLRHPSHVTLMPDGRLVVMDMEACRGLIVSYKSDQ